MRLLQNHVMDNSVGVVYSTPIQKHRRQLPENFKDEGCIEVLVPSVRRVIKDVLHLRTEIAQITEVNLDRNGPHVWSERTITWIVISRKDGGLQRVRKHEKER